MTEDIYSARIHLEGPSQAASFYLWFEQSVDNDSFAFSTEALAQAVKEKLNVPLRAILSSQYRFTGVTVRQHTTTLSRGFAFRTTSSLVGGDQVGTGGGVALPANIAMVYSLAQQSFGPKSNGRLFIPGIPEQHTAAGIITAAFQNGAMLTFAQALASNYQASGDLGVYVPGVISQKVLNALPPAKDWEGAFSPLASVSSKSILGVQKKRTTKVVGALSA